MELGKVKAQIEKYSKENGIDVQVAWDSFLFNELLYRISLSSYKNNYVFKGGFYLQKILGVGTRSTMDLDFKYSGVSMTDYELIEYSHKQRPRIAHSGPSNLTKRTTLTA